MPVYEYVGLNSKGKRVNGIVDAEHERAARVKLRRMGVFPTTLHLEGAARKLSLSGEVNLSRYFQSVSAQDVAVMTRQMATLLSASVPLVDSLNALIEQVENVKLRTVLTQVRERVTEGVKLSDAMRGHPKIFPDLYINMVTAGENSGAMDVVMLRLADFTESSAKLRNRVVGAMIYPAIMSGVGVLLMIGLLTFVVPKVTKIFTDSGAVLPLPTQILIGASSLLTNYWWALMVVAVGVLWFLRRYLHSPTGRAKWDAAKLRLPVFGKINRMVAIARFSRTLATLLSSGVPLLGALDIASNVVNNKRLSAVIQETRENVREGQGVAETLKRSGEFPPLVTHMIGIGEKTGELERMLERVADTYDGQVETGLAALTSLLEPLMILVMAGVVSFIVMSILLPILQLNQLGA